MIRKRSMPYTIRDTQFDHRLFADGAQYSSIRKAVEQLVSYHSIDTEVGYIRRLLKLGKVRQAREAVEAFDWSIEQVTEKPS